MDYINDDKRSLQFFSDLHPNVPLKLQPCVFFGCAPKVPHPGGDRAAVSGWRVGGGQISHPGAVSWQMGCDVRLFVSKMEDKIMKS